MMRLPPFRYEAPRTLAEAAELLARHGGQAMVVAGGTDLYPNMKRRQQEPSVLIGLRSVAELRGIQQNGQITIGAGVSLDELARSRHLGQAYPALTAAAGMVSTPHLRRMGTIGGNLCLDTRCTYYDQNYQWRKSISFCMKRREENPDAICWVAPGSSRCWAVSSSDCAPAAIALNASARLVSARGQRVVPLADLYRDDGIDYLTRRPDEILAQLILPPAGGWRSTYLKLRRRGSFDFPILGVAAAIREEEGIVTDVRLVLGAVASSPLDVSDKARTLIGERLTSERIEQAADQIWRSARPLDNTDLNYGWRKRMTRVYVKRALEFLAR